MCLICCPRHVSKAETVRMCIIIRGSAWRACTGSSSTALGAALVSSRVQGQDCCGNAFLQGAAPGAPAWAPAARRWARRWSPAGADRCPQPTARRPPRSRARAGGPPHCRRARPRLHSRPLVVFIQHAACRSTSNITQKHKSNRYLAVLHTAAAARTPIPSKRTQQGTHEPPRHPLAAHR